MYEIQKDQSVPVKFFAGEYPSLRRSRLLPPERASSSTNPSS